ncbi:flagellar basal body rod protein FlgB [Burkholderiaceae bacterium DAT-1]|nr:flagellar basal body rod protein FlgB [Burkholderiaceae bacterium DAT-1]
MLSKLDKYFSGTEKSMQLRSLRQEVLASNIANADTPNYKARDFDFGSAYKQALTSKRASGDSLSLARTDTRHIAANSTSSNGEGELPLLYRNDVQPSIDGNTVDMNIEMGHFTDNALRYQADITFMQQRISLYKAALQNQ